ncbi:MAG: zinc dependent phospholipase C family protein [Gemmatimonadales bacterium]
MRAASHATLALFSGPILAVALIGRAAGPAATLRTTPDATPRTAPTEARWKINTHLFAANKALADAIDDGMVSIPPYGELPIAASALRALRAAPASYRAGVLAPDLFPDMWTGGWFIHSDHSTGPDRWTADDWIRHVWSRARAWPDAGERDKVLAFAYGFVTHGAGDIFAHTYVNQKADGAWITFTGPARSTAVKHVVLEGYIGAHTPPTDQTLDVWPRLVSNLLIKDPAARQHSTGAAHYRRWVALYEWLGPQIDRARKQMENNVGADAPYWLKCSANPVPCARKEQMETWRLDVNRGLRALVDSSQTLGEQLMAHDMGGGVGAMTGWAKEWLPKMYGAHAIGEGMGALQQFLDWVGDPLAPINQAVIDEVGRFMKDSFPRYYELYRAVQDPATQMDQVGFPPGTRQLVNQEMGLRPGASTFDWRAFEPIYNTIVLSKLALLDGDGLNELARRAGLVDRPFTPGENTNLMLGVFRSMTQSYQWTGEIVRTDTGSTRTRFGICGPEESDALPPAAVCGARAVVAKPVPGRGAGGFVLWSHPAAREKIFRVVFKGFGPGPGPSSLGDAVANLGPALSAVAPVARALRGAADQAELMREIVAVMRGKVAGLVPAPAAPPTRVPAGGRPGGRPAPTASAAAPAAITDWGQRCCADDIAGLRDALLRIQAASRQLQPAVLGPLGRRPALLQLGGSLSGLDAALTGFANTRDARSAAAALDAVARQVDALARLVAGTL